jgi:hypothetical protein
MNATTRTPRRLQEDFFSVYCGESSSIEVFSFISGQLSSFNVSYTQRNNGFKSAEIQATADGYYFVRSGKNIQSLKKGNVEYKLFFFDGLQRSDLEITPESFDENGDKIGDNECVHIGHGIYAITPLVLTPSIIMIKGKVFYSFPNAKEIECEELKHASSTVSIGATQQPATISIGGSQSTVEIKNTDIGLSVGQTIFKV